MTFVDLNSTYRVTKAVKERMSTEMVEVFEGGIILYQYITLKSNFCTWSRNAKNDFTNFAETKSEKGKIIKTIKSCIHETIPKRGIYFKERHFMWGEVSNIKFGFAFTSIYGRNVLKTSDYFPIFSLSSTEVFKNDLKTVYN